MTRRRRNREAGERAAAILRRTMAPTPRGLHDELLAAVRRECAESRPRRASTRRALSRSLVAAVALPLTAPIAIALLAGFAEAEREPNHIVSVAFTTACPKPARHDDSIIVAGSWTDAEAVRFRRVVTLFERRTGARVRYEPDDHDIAKTIRVRVEHRCPPDVAFLPQPGLLDDLAKHGQIQPLDATTLRLVRRNYASVWQGRAELSSGKSYGVWFKAANKSTFWFDRSAFRQAGVTPPKTWDGLRRVAARLRAAGETPFAISGADGWTLTDWFENIYLATAGRVDYEALAKQRLKWTDPSVVAALKILAGIVEQPGWVTGGTNGALRSTLEASVGDVFSHPRKAAMVYEGDFVGSLIHDQGAVEKGDIGTFGFPSFGGRRSMVVGGDVAARFTHNPTARRFMQFIATPEAAVPWVHAGGFISPNRRLALDNYPDKVTRGFARALVRTKNAGFDLSDQLPPAFGATSGQGMWKILQDYLAQPRTIGAVTRDLQQGVTAAIACEQSVRGEC